MACLKSVDAAGAGTWCEHGGAALTTLSNYMAVGIGRDALQRWTRL